MSKNSIPSLEQVLEMIEAMKAFDVNDYVITTKDGKHKLNIKELGQAPIKMFIIDNEKQFIYFEFTNGQNAYLNKQDDSWIIEDRRSKGVYLIASDTITKIGIADEPNKRLRSLQTGSPVKLNLIGFWECKNPIIVEKDLHNKYESKRINGEWFNLSNQDIEDIREYFENANRKAT